MFTGNFNPRNLFLKKKKSKRLNFRQIFTFGISKKISRMDGVDGKTNRTHQMLTYFTVRAH